MEGQIISKLIEFFGRFPGIGPRQARRFVYFLAEASAADIEAFSGLLGRFKNEVSRCPNCFRIFSAEGASIPAGPGGRAGLCFICANPGRDKSKLLIVEKDIDLENIERSGVYEGIYYILGGLLSPLKPEIQERLRFKELFKKVERSAEIKEVVVAFSATTEGDMTLRYVESILEPFTKGQKIKISRLGRGLSTGTELEYSDRDTLRNAFENRK